MKVTFSDTEPAAPEGHVNVKWQRDALGRFSAYVPEGSEASPPGGSSDWGDIGGTLSDQLDLQAALDAKQALSQKNAANGYAGLSAGSKLDGTQQLYGTTANTACEGNDSRMVNAAPKVVVEAKTNGVGSPYSILSGDLNKCFTNEGASAEVYLNLPTAVAGLTFAFCCQAADGIRVVAAAGDTIQSASNVGAAAGYAKTTEQGAFLRLLAINATQWVAETMTGVWDIA